MLTMRGARKIYEGEEARAVQACLRWAGFSAPFLSGEPAWTGWMKEIPPARSVCGVILVWTILDFSTFCVRLQGFNGRVSSHTETTLISIAPYIGIAFPPPETNGQSTPEMI